jgi:hypothetical protein
MFSVGQTVVARAFFNCAGELSRYQQWRAAVSAPYPFGGEFRKEPLGFLVLEPAVLGRIQENPIFTIYFNS